MHPMKITRVNPETGEQVTLNIEISADQLDEYEKGYGHIQEIMPFISPGEREFIRSGTLPDIIDDLELSD